jgi:hypothetical protein
MMYRNPVGQRMRFNRMRRREFITLLDGVIKWPFVARTTAMA